MHLDRIENSSLPEKDRLLTDLKPSLSCSLLLSVTTPEGAVPRLRFLLRSSPSPSAIFAAADSSDCSHPSYLKIIEVRACMSDSVWVIEGANNEGDDAAKIENFAEIL